MEWDGGRTTGTARTTRAIAAGTWLVLVECFVFGLSAVPGLLTAQFIYDLPLPWGGKYAKAALVGIAFVPGYFAFCLALMFLTAMTCRLLGWRAQVGEWELKEIPWPLIRWAQYNAAVHVVRVFAGGILRATAVWTWFLRLNGAKVGRHVHVNTLSIYDHNLLTLGDGVVLGSDVKISAHVTERGRLRLMPVKLGRGVIVGTNTVVQPGVVVGDRTQVGAMSLVPKHSVLEPNAVYAGVPIQLIKRQEDAGPDREVMPPGGEIVDEPS